MGGSPLPAPTREQVQRDPTDELYRSVGGGGLASFRNTHSPAHDWIRDPARFNVTGRAYIRMLAVRGSIVPTPARLARGRPERNRLCEACGTSAMLNHIQQKCMRTHGARITRHDKIVDLICDGLTRRGWEVDREVRLNLPTRTVIPDLVARLGARTAILDVTAVGDQLDLEQAALAKVEKYSGDDIAGHVLEGLSDLWRQGGRARSRHWTRVELARCFGKCFIQSTERTWVSRGRPWLYPA